MKYEQFKPMLAATIKNPEKDIKFPVLGSRKLDGIRCIILDGKPYSRALKLIPNKNLQKFVAELEGMIDGYDGELMIEGENFQQVSHIFMSHDEPLPENWYFGAFDYVDTTLELSYHDRFAELLLSFPWIKDNHIKLIHSDLIENHIDLISFENITLEQGYEGVMLRNPNRPYKFGRSTLKEGALMKLKRFSDSEAVVIGWQEKMHNSNEATVSELGRTKRSSAKAGMVGMNTLGALKVCDLKTNIEFDLGSGINHDLAQKLFDDKENLPGKIVKYKYFSYGIKEKPRFPVFLGFRSELDM